MKKLITLFLTVLLSSGVLYASDDTYDSFKGSFGMYSVTAEMVALKKIESMTDPKTGKTMIGGMALEFEFFESELAQENGMQVAYVHFKDKKDEYILTFYVDGENVSKIILFSKNGDFINKALYPAENPVKKEDRPEGKEQNK